MDLRGGNITVREVLKHPGAYRIMETEFPGISGNPAFRLTQGMSLNQLLSRVGGSVPREKVQSVLDQLKAL